MEKIKDLSKVVIPEACLLIQDISDEAKESGIILTDGETKNAMWKGKVVVVGENHKGEVEVGDICFKLFPQMIMQFDYKDKKYMIVNRQNIFCIVKPENYR